MGAEVMAQVVKHLPSKCETLSSNTSTTINKQINRLLANGIKITNDSIVLIELFWVYYG
jgi:hypothetical protein